MCTFIFKRKKFPERTIDSIKNNCRVLFIDDRKFDIVDLLKEKDGWKRTTRIRDLESITQPDLLDAHIVFVDIQGVGKKMGMNSGLDLIVAIKEKYPEKKVIMYSAENQYQIGAFHKAANIVDYQLRKSTTRYEFDKIIEEFALEAFTFENCIKRVRDVLHNELSVELSEVEIKKKLLRIYNRGINEKNILSIFKIEKISSLSNIIHLFFDL